MPDLAFFLHKALQEPGEKTKAGSTPPATFCHSFGVKLGTWLTAARPRESRRKGRKQSDGQNIPEMEGSEIILSQPQHRLLGKILVRSIN